MLRKSFESLISKDPDTNGDVISEGKGKSKKKAEQVASMEALIKFEVIDREIICNEE